MGNQDSVITRFWQQQEKYIYYLIALSVAAIGFVIVNTKGEPLKWSQIPVGLAVISWGLSIFCGLRFIRYVLSSLYANKQYLDVLEGRHEKVGKHPQRIKAAATGIKEALKSNSDATESLGTYQNIFFYSGMILYLVWHVFEMYGQSIS